MHEAFDKFAKWCAWATGHAWSFIAATAICVLWLASGPLFAWSDTWQLIINTGTTILTFLMVFVIQNTQNRDTAEIKAMLREMVEDLPDVDEKRAKERATEECKP